MVNWNKHGSVRCRRICYRNKTWVMKQIVFFFCNSWKNYIQVIIFELSLKGNMVLPGAEKSVVKFSFQCKEFLASWPQEFGPCQTVLRPLFCRKTLTGTGKNASWSRQQMWNSVWKLARGFVVCAGLACLLHRKIHKFSDVDGKMFRRTQIFFGLCRANAIRFTQGLLFKEHLQQATIRCIGLRAARHDPNKTTRKPHKSGDMVENLYVQPVINLPTQRNHFPLSLVITISHIKAIKATAHPKFCRLECAYELTFPQRQIVFVLAAHVRNMAAGPQQLWRCVFIILRWWMIFFLPDKIWMIDTNAQISQCLMFFHQTILRIHRSLHFLLLIFQDPAKILSWLPLRSTCIHLIQNFETFHLALSFGFPLFLQQKKLQKK